MSGATKAEFIDYWQKEGEAYAKRGDYDWMASLVPGKRVLEIGCGTGFGTLALVKRGVAVLALDSLPECLEVTRERIKEIPNAEAAFLQAEVTTLDDAARSNIESFAPDTVVCWLMGAPAETTSASPSDGGQAVAAYREKVHRAVAELAASLVSVRALHLVDRTAIPWQAKDIGRDTLVHYHSGKTLANLPFTAERKNALYRKLEDKVTDLAGIRRSHPALKSVVPTLASLLAERKN
jgi:SAM-dependent methyltransferase